MSRIVRHVRVSAWVVATALLLSCSQENRGPTTPSAVLVSAPAFSWACVRQSATVSAPNGWSFPGPAEDCRAAGAVVPDVGIGVVSVAPGNLRSTITGTTVRLDWNALLEPVVGFLVEAGSGPALANLARLNTGSVALALVVNNVPNGEYFVRVRAIGPDGIPGPASNEIVVRVGGVPQSLPLAPTNFTAQVVNNQVTLSWTAPSGGDAPSSYVVEAGSAPTLSNIVVFDTADAATQLTAGAPNGRYFVRIRARTGAGVGPPSNELTIDVPGGVVGGCAYTVSPTSLRLASPNGGSFEVSVSITGSNPASCAWSAVSASSFITLISSPSSSGPGVARFMASANSDLTDRTGTIRITSGQGFSQDVTITQPGTAASCAYRVSPTVVPLSSEAGSFEIAVSTAAGCEWSASAGGFISVTSGGSASGPGSARFAVPANLDIPPRSGSVRISFPGGGQDVSVSQIGRPAPPPPSAPTVESVLQVPPQNDVIDQRPIQGPAPPVSPPNAGGCIDCRPVLNPGLVAIPLGTSSAQRGELSPQATGLSVMVALVSANGVPFNRVIVAPGSPLPDGSPLSASYQQITLASPRTSANIILTVVAGQPFTAQFAIVRDTQLPTGYAGAMIPVTPLGSGALQVTMTWNTTADMDIHVIDPNGAHVFYGNPTPTGSTARLDVDDTDGFGPENIFVATGAAVAGTYQVFLVHYSGPAPTVATIRVTLGTGPNALVRTFTRTTTAASPTTGVNVANVNVLTSQVTEVTGTRATPDGGGISSLSVGKKR